MDKSIFNMSRGAQQLVEEDSEESEHKICRISLRRTDAWKQRKVQRFGSPSMRSETIFVSPERLLTRWSKRARFLQSELDDCIESVNAS